MRVDDVLIGFPELRPQKGIAEISVGNVPEGVAFFDDMDLEALSAEGGALFADIYPFRSVNVVGGASCSGGGVCWLFLGAETRNRRTGIMRNCFIRHPF
jgi:hypothetical protein